MKRAYVAIKASNVKCKVCGKNLMDNIDMSMVNIVEDANKIVSVFPCCKGHCDAIIQSKLKNQYVDGWVDLKDFTNPTLYLKHIMSVLNEMYHGKQFATDEAFENYKELLIQMYPYVARDVTPEERENAVISNALIF